LSFDGVSRDGTFGPAFGHNGSNAIDSGRCFDMKRKMRRAGLYTRIHDRIKIRFLGNVGNAIHAHGHHMRRQKALTQTANRLRPLARLALMTARPPRVFMRTKKPCVRARRVFDGWYVRFMVGLSSS